MKRKKVSPTCFVNSHSCEAEKKFRKGAIKNEKHKIQRITIRRKIYEQSSNTVKR